jgi:PKD repeat protein
MEITYTPAAGGSAPVSSFTVNRPISRIPQVLTFTNTSTNTPTGWNWSWGDGTWTNGTTNNPTHQYQKRGIFPVFLLSSNAVGSNTSATQNIQVVGYENLW